MGFLAIFSALSPILSKIIDSVFPDKEKADAAKLEMQKQLNDAAAEAAKAEAEQMQAKSNVIQAEVNSDSWAAKNWRPYLMLICIAIVANNWMVTPLLNAFLGLFHTSIAIMPIPPELWTLVTVGLGGYIGKETVSTYSANKYNFNKNTFYSSLRQSIFKNGLSQDQVDAIEKAIKDSEK